MARVLVVDDDADGSELLAEILQGAGHDVRAVTDPLAALREIERFAPEVAIIDIGLPGMDGYELAQQARDLAPQCRLIALSGYTAGSARGDTTVTAFDQHLVKPVDRATLLRAIASS
jgi:CheY-like chemotaxis protein